MVRYVEYRGLFLMGIFNGTLYNKLIVQSTIKNPHKKQTTVFNISYHNFYDLGI